MHRLLRSASEAERLGAVCRRCYATSAADIGEIGIISGAPDYIFKRKVPVSMAFDTVRRGFMVLNICLSCCRSAFLLHPEHLHNKVNLKQLKALVKDQPGKSSSRLWRSER